MATRTGYKITVYLDDNPLSPTYMETYEEKTLDEETCPIPTDDLVLVSNECELTLSGYSGYRIATYYNTTTGEYTTEKVEDADCVASSTEEQWVNSGTPYCEVSDKGVNTGYMLQPQVQSNINLENYGETRVNRYKSPDCGSNGCAIWDDIQKQCHMLVTDCNIRFDGTSDVSQIDINPLSQTYNQTRTINRQDNECVNCTETVFNWVDLGTLCGDNEVLCNNGIQEVSINSYKVSQKYKTIGSGSPIPMDEYQVTLNLENDENCGYIPPQYRWDVVQGQYTCDQETYTKYQTLVKMVSYDGGVTWGTKQPIETKRGEVLALDSYDCGKPMERWVETGEMVCEDNGDDWKLKIVGASSTAIVPCDETEVLTQNELPTIPSDVSSVDFGDCITQIDCSISTKLGSSKNPATVHFGDYVEVIGNTNAQSSVLNGYFIYNEDSFDDNLRIINDYAFSSGSNTYSNNTAYLGSKIESIGYKAFRNSGTNLNTLKIDTVTPPSIGTNALFDYDIATYDYKTAALNCILVPRGSVGAYKSAWYGYKQYIHSLAEEDTFYRATYSDGTRGWNFSSEGTNGVLDEHMVLASYGGHFKSSITDVYISNEVTVINRGAFSGCTSLSGLNIPSSVEYIYSDAFNECPGKTEDHLNYIDTYLVGFATKLVGFYTVKNGTRFIGKSIWSSIEKYDINSFSIPSSVEYIGSLPKTYSGHNTTWWDNFLNTPSNWQNGVAYLNKYAVASESGITELNLRSGTVGVGSNAFQNVEFTTIEFPSTLKYIGDNAFEFCNGLDGVALPESLIEIGGYSFCGTDQTSVTIPSNVMEIGDSAFWMTPLTSITINCAYVSELAFKTNYDVLTTIILGENVKELEDMAFSGRKNALKVYSYASTPPILGSSSISSRKGVTVYVPSELVNIYKSATNWSNFTINPII